MCRAEVSRGRAQLGVAEDSLGKLGGGGVLQTGNSKPPGQHSETLRGEAAGKVDKRLGTQCD